MRKAFILLIAVSLAGLSALSGCGGSGGANTPEGYGTGIPTEIRLIPSQTVVRTGGSVILYAKLVDGNGHAIKDKTVSFAEKSGIGVLTSSTAKTNEKGVAAVTLTSTAPGVAIVEASTSSHYVMDRKSVVFRPSQVSPNVIVLEVDGNGDGAFDECDDYYDISIYNRVRLRATLTTNTGVPVANQKLTFYTSDFIEDPGIVTFYDDNDVVTNTVYTDANGVAYIYMRVTELFNRYSITVFVYDSTYAIAQQTMYVHENYYVTDLAFTELPQVVAIEDPLEGVEVTVSVQVYTQGGLLYADGIPVYFDIGGSFFVAYTLDGVAEVTTTLFYQGVTDVTVYAGCQPVILEGEILVTSEMSITPSAVTFDSTYGGVGVTQYVVSGSISPYTITFTEPYLINIASPTQDGDSVGTPGANTATFEVWYDVPTQAELSFLVHVRSSTGDFVISSVSYSPEEDLPAPSISPSTVNVACFDQSLSFTVSGGTSTTSNPPPSYTVNSSQPLIAYDTVPGNGQWDVNLNGGSFTVNIDVSTIPSGSGATITLTALDSFNETDTATITIGTCP